MGIWPEVICNIYWSIGDVCITNFWDDVWIRQVGSLRDLLGNPSHAESTLRVCDV